MRNSDWERPGWKDLGFSVDQSQEFSFSITHSKSDKGEEQILIRAERGCGETRDRLELFGMLISGELEVVSDPIISEVEALKKKDGRFLGIF